MIFKYIENPQFDQIKYRRILFLGVRDQNIHLNNKLHQNSEISIKDDLEQNPRDFPVLLKWEKTDGTTKYAHITRD